MNNQIKNKLEELREICHKEAIEFAREARAKIDPKHKYIWTCHKEVDEETAWAINIFNCNSWGTKKDRAFWGLVQDYESKGGELSFIPYPIDTADTKRYYDGVEPNLD